MNTDLIHQNYRLYLDIQITWKKNYLVCKDNFIFSIPDHKNAQLCQNVCENPDTTNKRWKTPEKVREI